MSEPASPKKSAPNWKKLALIPVLGAVLLYAVASPSDEAAPPTLVVRPAQSGSTNSPAPSTPVSSTNASSSPTAKKPLQGTTTTITWPATPLEEVLAHNPFRMPAELRPLVASVTEPSPMLLTPGESPEELEVAKGAELREALKGQRLTALVQTTKGVGAIVGDNVVGVGDLVGERLRVTAIRPDGVLFELIDKPAKTGPANDK